MTQQVASTSSNATQMRLSTPKQKRRLDRGRLSRAGATGAFLLAVLALVPSLGSAWTSTLTGAAIYAVVAASLGVLYGRVGIISLGQGGFLVIATWIGARLAYATDLPFPVLIAITGLITMTLGLLIGLPALRMSGLHLALLTLMFAGAVSVVLSQFQFPNGGAGFLGYDSALGVQALQGVRRPEMATSDTAYFRYVVVVCALMFALAWAHVATKPGRAWKAIRQSETSALAAGVNVTLYRLWAFALAAFMTGAAGALYAAQLGHPSAQSFATQDSITLLAAAMIGGIFSMWGAVIAGLFIQAVPFLFTAQGIWGWHPDGNILTVFFGLGLLQVLLGSSGGMAEQLPKDMRRLGSSLSRLARRVRGQE
jgi:branched-chain amino acid transport system permease protein